MAVTTASSPSPVVSGVQDSPVLIGIWGKYKYMQVDKPLCELLPNGLVVQIWCFHCCGVGSILSQGSSLPLPAVIYGGWL